MLNCFQIPHVKEFGASGSDENDKNDEYDENNENDESESSGFEIHRRNDKSNDDNNVLYRG